MDSDVSLSSKAQGQVLLSDYSEIPICFDAWTNESSERDPQGFNFSQATCERPQTLMSTLQSTGVVLVKNWKALPLKYRH